MNQPAAEMYGRLNANMAAFPSVGAEKVHPGLTKREHIAILFMAASSAIGAAMNKTGAHCDFVHGRADG